MSEHAATLAAEVPEPWLLTIATAPDPHAVIALYAAAGWGRASAYDAATLAVALARTPILVAAWLPGDRLVGLARAFGDGVIHTALAEVLVHPAQRGRGIGQALVGAVSAACAGTALYAEALPGQAPFFARCGLVARPAMTVLSRPPTAPGTVTPAPDGAA